MSLLLTSPLERPRRVLNTHECSETPVANHWPNVNYTSSGSNQNVGDERADIPHRLLTTVSAWNPPKDEPRLALKDHIESMCLFFLNPDIFVILLRWIPNRSLNPARVENHVEYPMVELRRGFRALPISTIDISIYIDSFGVPEHDRRVVTRLLIVDTQTMGHWPTTRLGFSECVWGFG